MKKFVVILLSVIILISWPKLVYADACSYISQEYQPLINSAISTAASAMASRGINGAAAQTYISQAKQPILNQENEAIDQCEYNLTIAKTQAIINQQEANVTHAGTVLNSTVSQPTSQPQTNQVIVTETPTLTPVPINISTPYPTSTVSPVVYRASPTSVVSPTIVPTKIPIPTPVKKHSQQKSKNFFQSIYQFFMNIYHWLF